MRRPKPAARRRPLGVRLRLVDVAARFRLFERVPARLIGMHRALCVYSFVHRGTPERPGLVLGLDRGGMCRGIAFRVAAAAREKTVAYLREREQVTSVYLEKNLTVEFSEGAQVSALTYVVDRAHPQYAGRLPVEEIIRLVSGARGGLRRQSRLCPQHLRTSAAPGHPRRGAGDGDPKPRRRLVPGGGVAGGGVASASPFPFRLAAPKSAS